MRVVDSSVPAKGFKAHDGQTFKILASYDGLCNVTKIYINDKLRGGRAIFLFRRLKLRRFS